MNPVYPMQSSSHHPTGQIRISTPDLTTSPASSVSSAIDDCSSMPLADFPTTSPAWADLNPYAQPFVPGSLLMHNPLVSKDQLNAQLLASIPVDYLKDTADGLPDFKVAPLSDWDTFSEEPLELLEDIPHLPSTLDYPPGLRIPPTYLIGDLPPPAVPPSYLSLISDCLRPGTQDHEIESYSRVIITSRPRWELESLIELSERICVEMYNPCTPPADKAGHVITACDPARYIPVDPIRSASNNFFMEHERGAQRQHAIAILVRYLHQHLSIIQNTETSQLFMWNLRESALTRFRETWDIESLKGRAISLSKPATSYDVRCALTLCKSIASFFSQNLITHRHITMCINILLKHLMSVEHVEALALLILGCGPAFWDVSTLTKRGGHHECTADLVKVFLTGLVTSVRTFSLLHDPKSLVFPREAWGEGQLMMRLNQIEVAVKEWEVLLSESA